MRNSWVLSALFGLLVVTGCNSSDTKEANKAANGDAVELKFNLQKGKSYTYTMDMEMEGEMQGQKLENDMAFEYSVEVVDDKDSLKTLKTTYDRIKMEMNAGQMNMHVDTNEPQQDSAADPRQNPMAIMSNMFHAMKGKAFEMKVNNRGEVVSVSGMEEMMNAMMNSMAVDETMKQTMAQAFQSQFNEESVKQSFAQAFNIFPDKAVKVGDTWTKSASISGMASADVATVYKVKEIKADEVVLDVSADLSINGGKGTQTGTMKVDATSGLVTDAEMEQKLTSPQPMTIKYKIKGREN